MNSRGEMSVYKCACCGLPFTARTADRARGWAKFCSKKCKAIKQMRSGPKGRPTEHIRYPDGTSTTPRSRPSHQQKQAQRQVRLGSQDQREGAEAMAIWMFGWTP